MIIKSPSETSPSTDALLRAGQEAERQMAFYLHRAFATAPDIHILNDLRIEDPNQPDSSGAPGVCQIDHLAIHQWGVFIIESKSVTDRVSVRADDTGGDEWTRRYRGRDHGFQSPIQQARRQAEFLRAFLQTYRESLLGKQPTGLRAISKLVTGSDQRGFRNMPAQIIVAISDNGDIKRAKGWKEPTQPFRTFVTKADLVPDKIKSELAQHASSARLLGEAKGDYGAWSMKPDEAQAVAHFLASRHAPRTAVQVLPEPPTPKPALSEAPQPACKACNTRQPLRPPRTPRLLLGLSRLRHKHNHADDLLALRRRRQAGPFRPNQEIRPCLPPALPDLQR